MAREVQPASDAAEPIFVHRRISGTLVIGILLTFGAVLAGIGWWSHHVEIYRPRQLWGAEHALRIRDAQQVEVWLLEPAGLAQPGQEMVTVAGERCVIAKRVNAAQVRGVSDVRRALIADFAFDWEHDARTTPLGWQFALALKDGAGQTTVAFSPGDNQVALLETGAEGNVTPVAEFFTSFFRRALSLPAPGKDGR